MKSLTQLVGTCVVSLALMVGGPLSALTAQDTDPRCAPARADLAAAEVPVRQWAAAVTNVTRCPETGPGAIVQLWNNPPEDSLMLVHLVRRSGNFHDERVFAKLLEVADDPARSNAIRLEAVRALFPQLRHCILMGSMSPMPPEPNGDTLFTLVSTKVLMHSMAVSGSEPRRGDIADRIIAVLRRPPSDRELRAMFSGAAKAIELASRSSLCQE